MAKRTAKNKIVMTSKITGILAVVVLLVGAMIAWKQYQGNKAAMEASRTTSVNAPYADESTPPSTDKPGKNEFDSYKVAADAPRYIFIPKISVEAIVKPMGLDGKGRIGAPANVHHAGWFTGSAKPGQPGAMIVDGHLSSWETAGIFYDLKKLKTGDIITIERGDGKKFDYKVAKTQTYAADNVDMGAVLQPINPGKFGLNLITCAGNVIKGTNDFDKRLVVFAEQK